MPLERLQLRKAQEILPSGSPLSHKISLRPQTSRDFEVIPDSQELEGHILNVSEPQEVVEIIEISSDESDEDRNVEVARNVEKTPSRHAQRNTRRPRNHLHVARRQIIHSSDEESENEVIEISDSDSSIEFIPTPARSVAKPHVQSVYDDTSHPGSPSRPEVDESIIILDEPSGARTPLRLTKKNTNGSILKGNDQVQTTPKKTRSLAGRALLNNIPSLLQNTLEGSKPTEAEAEKSASTPRVNTKKGKLTPELQQRHAYAQQVFNDLNKSVFKDRLPSETNLNWNKRLLTTAGKAKYHRSRDGVQTTEIELAEKILDCEERIRNTLSHEMCHLATWVIDKNIKEHHGPLFKSWAEKVMKIHPHINVSVKHNYEISYPYQWKCGKCAKIYGRFSKSIKPEECVCGACREGTLIPQFTSRRKPNTPKLSRMAAAKPQDSPRAKHNSPSVTKKLVDMEFESDSEDAVLQMLTKSLALTTLV